MATINGDDFTRDKETHLSDRHQQRCAEGERGQINAARMDEDRHRRQRQQWNDKDRQQILDIMARQRELHSASG
ncbi:MULTISPECIES: hypothetical protein [Sphingobium]|uniref:hypothetical protein n=1 Tax=Sphingobium TaxID=165695 RepID=UPI0005CBF9B7|nr:MULTISPECIES: hypothetical protein [Sphingobium]AJR23531.1 hypothetical protein TZ53_07130 [Sphingobium sp. YBL2]MCB4860324.1 hypothetical protein [Sphingobium sp. PNB]RYL98311.1 hypothetical protein EWH10_12975 [Sphingobium fuliginis]